MQLSTIVVGPLGVNCYLIGCESTKRMAVVDPGDDAAKIWKAVNDAGYHVEMILNTHGHFDHIGGNSFMKKETSAPLLIHEADSVMLNRVAATAAMYGCTGVNSPDADRFLTHGEVLTVGEITLEVRHTPGHTRGGCCFYLPQQALVLTGDTLFADSVGRTDLPGGSHPQLITSITEQLMTLPDETVVYPGHGPKTTIGHERRHNPYLD